MEQDTHFHINGWIEWKTKVPSSHGTFIDSPTFRLLGSDWRLQFSHFEHDTDFINLYYGLVVSLIPNRSEDGGEETLQTPFSVVTYIGHPTDLSQTPVAWAWREIADRSMFDIWNPYEIPGDQYENMDRLCNGGEVRIVCLFYGTNPSPIGDSENLVEKSVQVLSEVPQDMESLSKDFSNLLEKEILPDVILECGGRTFRAHRSVLGARSEVFRAMFQNETLEYENGALKVQDMDVAVFQNLLKFVYTGKPENVTESTVADLYEAANKYGVHSLRKSCMNWIVRNLTAENCVKYLVFADCHYDGDLKNAVVSFINENPSVLMSDDWRTVASSDLAIEVFQTYIAAIQSGALLAA